MKKVDVNKKTLSRVLSEHMNSAKISDAALHSRIQEHFPERFWVSSEINIRRWRKGKVKSVRNWRQLIGVAAGLFLDEDKTDELLESAGLPTLDEVRMMANEEESAFLASQWTGSTPQDEIISRIESLEARFGRAFGRDVEDSELELPAPSEDILDPGSLPPSSRIILRSNHLFTGRQRELRRLLAIFQTHTLAAIVGLGGVGKTQLAVEFAHRYGRFFAGGVFFLSCGDPSNIESEIAACGGLDGLGLHVNFQKRPLSEQVRLVKSAWREPIPRLLVFDNLENPSLLKELLPTSGGCRILITSRRSAWPITLGINQVELEPLMRTDSAQFLCRFVPQLELELAEHIAKALGDLPLALDVAGRYMRTYQRSIPPEEYLAQILGEPVLKHESLRGYKETLSPTDHGLHVGRTFSISYDKLDINEPIDALALNVLSATARLAPGEPMPLNLLEVVTEEALPREAPIKALEDSLGRLSEIGLIKDDGQSIHLHRLVAAFVRNQPHGVLDVENAVQRKLQQLNKSRSIDPLTSWLPHLKHVVRQSQKRADVQAAKTAFCFGEFLHWRGNLKEALDYLLWALQIQEALLGEVSTDTAATLKALGIIYSKLNKLQTARTYHERALVIRHELLGPNDKKTLHVMNNIGVLLLRSGELSKAKTLLDDVHEIKLRRFGDSERTVAISFGNLGLVAHISGALEKAQEYYKRSLAIKEKVFGLGHSSTATTILRLGVLHYKMGELASARDYLDQSVTLFGQVWGEKHPAIAGEYKSLGLLFQANKDIKSAEICFDYAIKLATSILGSEHEETQELTELYEEILMQR